MTNLEIHLMGSPRITLDGNHQNPIRSDKVYALLAFLCVETDQPHRREKLAGMLWPDYPERSARANLRRALSDLRKSIRGDQAEPPYLLITNQTIQFNLESQSSVDVNQFKKLTNSNRQARNPSIKDRSAAVDLYVGDFMEGFSLPDSSPFEEWMLLTKQHLQREFLDNCSRLVKDLENQGKLDSALKYAWRQLEVHPNQESSHRHVMRLLQLNGHRDMALAQYDVCRNILARELGIEPSLETRQLYTQILSGEFPQNVTTGIDHQPDSGRTNPYRGLFAFKEEDAPFFFGRELFTKKLLGKVKNHSGLTAIIGSSGSGKSSVVHAGLVPYLRESDWLIVCFRPGSQPFFSLANTVLPFLENDLSETDLLIETQKLAQALSDSVLTLAKLLDHVMIKNSQVKNLLIIIDQFEEIYSLCTDQQLQLNFIDQILHAVRKNSDRQEPSTNILLTMRIDFMRQAIAYPPFADALQRSVLLLGAMTQEEMRHSIEKPSQILGAAFEKGLVERLLKDIGPEQNSLPLQQFALTLLWENSKDDLLTHEAYEQIGHIHGALARYADQVYDELDEAGKKAARHIFVQLVHPGENTEDIRRQANLIEIGEENWLLVRHLADKRLVVTNQDVAGTEIVELVHEALIDHWDYLREWLEMECEFRTWQDGLRNAQRKWENSGKDEGALLRGLPLVEARAWADVEGINLSPTDKDFIQASISLFEKKDLEQKRTRRRISIGLSVCLLIMIVLAAFAAIQWHRSDIQRVAVVEAQATAQAEHFFTQKALSGLLAVESRNLLDEQYDMALLLGIESLRRVETLEGRGSLFTVLSHRPGLLYFLHGHQNDIRSLAFHPKGRLLASGDADGIIYLWNTETRQPYDAVITGHQDQISDLAFSPDGSLLASSSFDHTILLWDMDPSSRSFGQAIKTTLMGHSGNIWGIAFSPDGEKLASAGMNGEIILWDTRLDSATFGQIIIQLPSYNDGIITSLEFSPDGSILVSGGADSTIILWDLESGKPLIPPLKEHSAFVSCVAFSPDGSILASGSKDNTILLWDVNKTSKTFGEVLTGPLTGHTDSIWDIAFNPAGGTLFSSSEDGKIFQWNVDTTSPDFGTPFASPIMAHGGAIYALAFNPDGSSFATGGGDKKVQVWNSSQDHPLVSEYTEKPDVYYHFSFSPDGEKVAVTSMSRTVYVHPVIYSSPPGDSSKVMELNGHSNQPHVTAFNPDGTLLATGDDDDIILLWDMDVFSNTYGQQIGSPLTGHLNYVRSLIFNPDGTILISVDIEGFIIFWDLDTTRMITSFKIKEKLDRAIAALSLDGNTLALASRNGSVSFWNVEFGSASFGQQLNPSATTRHNGLVHETQFSPDGNLLVTAGGDGTIRFWDADTNSRTFGRQIETPIIDQSSSILSIDFSPDGKYLASGDLLGNIKLWDVSNKKVLGLPAIGTKNLSVEALNFSPDGTHLSALFRNGKIITYEFSLESWLKTACQRVNRNLTPEEWNRYYENEPYRPTCPEPDI